MEVLTGTPRRRRWSEEEKAAIVAESLAPGSVARTVALRHGLHPNQLYGWRRALASADGAGDRGASAGFVPVALAVGRDEARGSAAGAIEIEVGGAVVRVAPGVDVGLLGAVLRAVRAAGLCEADRSHAIDASLRRRPA